MVNGRF